MNSEKFSFEKVVLDFMSVLAYVLCNQGSRASHRKMFFTKEMLLYEIFANAVLVHC